MDRIINAYYPMKKSSWVQIGGTLDAKIEIHSVKGCYNTLADIARFHFLYFVYGKGSNLLFQDEYQHTIALHIAMKNYRIIEDILFVDAGISLAYLARVMIEKGYLHFAGLFDIPGELGGAIYNNAGAFQDTISDTLIDVFCMKSDGECVIYSRDELAFSYRTSRFQKEDLGIILHARFRLEKGNQKEILKRKEEYHLYRITHQPCGIRTLGSTFKNPKEGKAAYFIEKAGLKGFKKGKVKISEKHANFLEIEEDTLAKEVMNFVYFIQSIVYNKYTILLEIEIETKDLKGHGRGKINERK